jgi:SanA protein
VVSQQFHNERAIYTSRHHGIDAIGFNATEVDAYNGFMTSCREQLARVKTVLDVHVINRQSRLLGEPIVIGGDEA